MWEECECILPVGQAGAGTRTESFGTEFVYDEHEAQKGLRGG